MENLIIIITLVIILGLAGYYVYKSKKSGKKCIGCPEGCVCSSKKNDSACNCKNCN